MRVTFLGTGTSVGVPMIGCECAVCRSDKPKNKRRRASIFLQAGGQNVVVDTPPDFREQVLQFRIPRVDAVLFTHSHADHVFGFDDIRRFNTMQKSTIPVYGSDETVGDLKRIFNYVLNGDEQPGLFRPRIDFRTVSGPFSVGEVAVEPLQVFHDPKHTIGFLFRSEGQTLGYFPDCKGMEQDVIDKVKGVDVMILDALRHREHSTHMTVAQSLEVLGKIGAKKSYLTHMCHDLDHDETEAGLPAGVKLSYDGLVLEW